jgi:TonB-linked SusC/RagA family outer membrane protein
MQFKALCDPARGRILTQTLLAMKFTAIFLLTACLAASASGYSQITLSETNAPLQKVFREIQKQCGYDFLCTYEMLEKAGTVSVKVNNVSVQAAVEACLKGKGLAYEIQEKTIVIKPVPVPDFQHGETSPPLPPPGFIDVHGRVLDEKGKPLAGVTVAVKDSKTATSTNENGEFSIRTPDKNATLVLSFVGYENKEVKVTGRSGDLTIQLAFKNSSLGDIVVIGYGTQRKSDLTGAVSTVSIKKVDEIPLVSVDQILSGRAGGVQITQASGQAGAGTSIRIRGGNSLNGTNEPLFVVDGFPIINDNSALAASGPLGLTNTSSGNPGQGNPSGALNWLNPADIESMEILKDASATAIYGSRGANGVVIITTKKGKAGQAKLNFNVSDGFSNFNQNKIHLLNAQEYANYDNLYNEQTGNTVWYKDTTVNGKLYPSPSKLEQGTNWLDAITRTGHTQNYSLGFSGGKDVLYSGSGSFIDQTTPILGSDFKRANFRLNLQTDLNDWLSFDNSTTLSLSVINNAPADTRDIQKFGPFEAALLANPVEPVYNSSGTLNYSGGDPSNIGAPKIAYNPIALANDVLNRNTIQTILENVSLKAKIIKGLNFETRGSVFVNNGLRDIYYNSKTTFNGAQVGGLAGKNSNNTLSALIENFATYNERFGRNAFNAVAGYSYQTTTTKTILSGASGFPNDNLKNEALSSGSTQYPTVTNKIVDLLSSCYVRLNNIYDNKYSVTFTARYDGSSKFGPGNKWALFPSGAVSWKLKEEDFLKDADAISDLKLRVSYGVVGNQAIQSLQSKSLLAFNNYPIGGTLQTGVLPSVLGNSNLKWETTKEFNAGIDFGLFNRRLTGSLNYYIKNTSDLLQQQSIPSNSGFSTIYANVGSISNKGIELELHASIISTRDFNWDLDFNIAHNKQILTSLGLSGSDTLIAGFDVVGGQADYVALIKGQPVGEYYGYRRNGIFQSAAEAAAGPALPGAGAGSVRIKDINKDGVINDKDRTVIGDPNPKFTYGIINNFSYKRFDLNFVIQGVSGGNIYNVGQYTLDRLSYGTTASLDYWSATNPNAKYPAPGFSRTAGADLGSDFWVKSATYMRLKAATLGYNFPTEKIKFFKSLRIYVSGSNLFTITKYNGFDPEVNSFGQSNLFRNIDNLTVPIFKTYLLGINLGF